MRPLCIISEPHDFCGESLGLLAKYFDVQHMDSCSSERLSHAQVIFVRLSHYVGREFLARFPLLRAICSPTTGLNHIDVGACVEKEIDIISLRGEVEFLTEHITATAEFTWALFLNVWRRINSASCHVQKGGWDRDLFKSRQLKGRQIAIIGMGRVGKQIRGYAEAFGMVVTYFDPNVTDSSGRYTDLHSLFKDNDILFVCCAATSETEGMIGIEALSCLPQGSVLVNTARGEIVNETALAGMLQEKTIYYAADVLANEQNRNSRSRSPLLSRSLRSQVLITPHIAGACTDAMNKTELFVTKKLLERLC